MSELKDQRVVTMMTPGELSAIDDWMFAHRIKSRGEAIRRLCQMAMLMEPKAKSLEAKMRHIVVDQGMDAGDILGTNRDSSGPAEDVGPRVKNHLAATRAAMIEIAGDAIGLGMIADAAAEPGSVEEAIAQAYDAFASKDEVGEIAREGREIPYYGQYPK